MTNYVGLSDINIMLGTSGEDLLLSSLNLIVTSMINNYLQVTTLYSTTYTESYTNSILKAINPTSIVTINGVVPVDYKLEGRRLIYNLSSVENEVVYIAGFTVIPEDIKGVVYNLVSYLYNKRKAGGIEEFTQGQLRVKYSNGIKEILEGLKFYKKNNILSN